MNNLYIYSPMYVKTDDIWPYFQGLTYLELIENEMSDKSQPRYCISDRFDFLKAIELVNRTKGQIDNLVIASEMYPYGINLCWGDPEGIVTIDRFYEYPHAFDIKNVKLIGLNANRKLKDDKETFVESLLAFVKGEISYYDEPFFKIDIVNKSISGKFSTVSKNKT